MPTPDDLPLVSVILPIRNEGDHIDRTLEAVLDQDYPGRLEIVVADGRSTDDTRERVRAIATRLAGRNGDVASIVLVDNAHGTMPHGANVAIRHARGEVHLILGGHTRLPRDYVRRCVEGLQTTGADCVGGAMVSSGRGYVAGAIGAAMGSPFGVGGSGFRVASGAVDPVVTDTVPFGLYRREVWDRIGLYNPAMVRHQDYELNYRLRKAGGRIMLLPALRVDYFVRPTLGKLWSQYWQYGVWKGRFLHAHPASLRARHLAPPLLVLGLVAGIALAFTGPTGRLVLGGMVAVYGAFLAVAVVALARAGAARYAPLLPPVLACLHLSYGLGVWVGLLTPLPVRERTAPPR